MSKLIWRLKQLLPLTYWTTYQMDTGQPRFVIWRMWFGRCFNVVDVPVSSGRPSGRDVAQVIRNELRRERGDTAL